MLICERERERESERFVFCFQRINQRDSYTFSPIVYRFISLGTLHAPGIFGWSYYLRAFNLIREETPTQEIGWGQWSKPSTPPSGKPLNVCGFNPAGFVCDDPPSAEQIENYNASCYDSKCSSDDESCPCLTNCGAPDYMTRRECKFWKCNTNEKGGVSGSIEGGMGYWPYTIVSSDSRVKYMLPGSTSSNYEVFGGTLLNDRYQDCTSLGGAVRVSNNLIIPNDFVMFEGGDDIDGFLGYMLTRAPIGKRSATDDANLWTIILDAGNFAGPVMYVSNWFWDQRTNFDPTSASWSDPRSLIGYIAQGFEGGLGAFSTTKDDKTYYRTNRFNFPIDKGATYPSSTLMTGHSQYNTDWAAEAMEWLLSGTGTSSQQAVSYIRTKAASERSRPQCNVPTQETKGRITDRDEFIWDLGFGGAPSNMTQYQTESDAAHCHVKLMIDPTKFDCTSKVGWCQGRRYLSRDTSGTPGSASEAIYADSDVPVDVKSTLDSYTFVSSKVNDGRFLGPSAALDRPCFECPGPAPQDSKLYCVRTVEKTWIGFRWYRYIFICVCVCVCVVFYLLILSLRRFVDQPELNQVFASISNETERAAAKCFMQARIERLHAATNNGVDSWFEPPQGTSNLPADKVMIDSSLIVEPPPGLEVGYVPIPVYNRLRWKPSECDVVLGQVNEPDPVTTSYYDNPRTGTLHIRE
jgi:hypothetical protein